MTVSSDSPLERRIYSNNASGIRLIQLTDTHLFGDAKGRLIGYDTNDSFLAVLEHIKAGSQPDFIIITGDLSQDDSIDSYQWLKTQLLSLKIPFFWTQGNHDQVEFMSRVCSEAMMKRIDLGSWQLILLNSQIPGETKGFLDKNELERLNRYLCHYPDQHSIITFHHPPYAIDSSWLDRISLENSEAFLSELTKHSHVRAVINGHIHQEQERLINGVHFFSTPSTSIQFKPESANFALDDLSPGYREIHLHDNGNFTTQVVRLKNYHQRANHKSDGY